MDQRFVQAGQAVTYCPYIGLCPGIRDGRVVNDWQTGVISRGLIVRPADATPESVEVVILGQNPGNCDHSQRQEILQIGASVPHHDVFEAINSHYLQSMVHWPYHVNIDSLLDALWPNGSRKHQLYAEVAYCENAPDVSYPGTLTMRFCASQHLANQLDLLPDSVTVICVGKPAFDWFSRSRHRNRFLYCRVDHVTGVWGTMGKLLDVYGRLKSHVRAQWSDLQAGRVNGVHLGK